MSVLAGFVAGYRFYEYFNVGAVSAKLEDEARRAVGYELVAESQALLDQYYLSEQPDYAQRQYAAIRGLLASLNDPNTFLIEPSVAQNEANALSGVYGGIGVRVTRNERGEILLYPFEESPAARAGVEAGDILIAVNGLLLDLREKPEAVEQRLRGEIGMSVEIMAQKEDETVLSAVIEFEAIEIPSVVFRVLAEDARIGLLQIMSFTNRTPDELSAALTALNESGIQALILDLRDNNGGLLKESIAVADQFLNAGVVIYERAKTGERVFETDDGGLATDLPLVVLVNQGTASASELLAGAIQDRERGILIGQQTFGKGTIQQIHALSDGSSLHITSAEWLTPDRRSLAGVGLEPTIFMIPDENGRDIELGEAIRVLRQALQEEEE